MVTSFFWYRSSCSEPSSGDNGPGDWDELSDDKVGDFDGIRSGDKHLDPLLQIQINYILTVHWVKNHQLKYR